MSYQITENFSATAAYERYVMDATGGTSGRSPDQAYVSADIWTFGIQAAF